jgi:hypothetical protein
MSSTLPEPQRWSDASGRGSSAEEGLGASLRRVRQATDASDAALLRAARRLDEPPPRSRLALLVWRVTLVVLLVMATGGVVGAALHRWWGGDRPADAPRSPSATPVPAAARAPHGRRHHEAAWPAAEAPALTERPAEAPSVSLPGPAPVAAVDRIASLTVPALRPARERRSSHEGSDLAGVFRALRSGGDAGAALRALDAYDRRFPHGAFASEARIARAEALVALNRRAEALPLLVGIEDGGDSLTPDARVTRGELLADAHRCDEAVRDFAAVLAVAGDGAAAVRALYGRARCLQAAGDGAAARRDLEQLLARHADERFAAAARRLLESLPSP